MKNIFNYLLIFLLVPILVTTSCKKDPAESTDEFKILTKYVKDNTLDLNDILTGWVKPGSAIGVNDADYSVPDYYVIDLRGAADFDAGHIKDAHNVTLSGILGEAAKADGKKILVVCYTGQTAARGTAALKLKGYDATCLKWGMSGWNTDFDSKWVANAKDITSPSWVSTGTPVPTKEFATVKLSTGKKEGADILAERVDKMLTLDWKVTNSDVLANPGNYFINNKWPQDAWDAYGHITGSYRINEDVKVDGLKNLDNSKTIVTYCFTGQTSSITTAWLQAMGYDNARSLLFGANGINHSALVVGDVAGAHKKSWHGEGSASELNYGYYDTAGNYHAPK